MGRVGGNPGNRGNTRLRKNTIDVHKGGGISKQTPWRKDPIIRERMQLVHKLWAEGYGNEAILVKVNTWAALNVPTHPRFGISVIQNDKKNIISLVEEGDDDLRIEHLESLKHLKQVAYEEFERTTVDMAKPSLLNVIRAAEETGAKIDGSLIKRVEQNINVTSATEARILVQVLVRHLGSEELAMRVLQEVETKVIEAGTVDGQQST